MYSDHKKQKDMKYIVQLFQDDTYQVLEITEGEYDTDNYEVVYQGSLADCEAYIRLKEGGYM